MKSIIYGTTNWGRPIKKHPYRSELILKIEAWNKWRHFAFNCIFKENNLCLSNIVRHCSYGSNCLFFYIGSCKGLVPARRQTITRNNAYHKTPSGCHLNLNKSSALFAIILYRENGKWITAQHNKRRIRSLPSSLRCIVCNSVRIGKRISSLWFYVSQVVSFIS